MGLSKEQKEEFLAELGIILRKNKLHPKMAEKFLPFAKKLGITAADIDASIEAYTQHGGHASYYIESYLPKILDSVKSAKQVRIIPEFVKDYAEAIRPSTYNLSAYVANALPELFKSLKSDEQVETIRELIKDYMKRFEEPYGYVEKVLPTLIRKTKNDERLKLWDAEFKKGVEDFHECHGESDHYVLDSYCYVVAAAKSLWQLEMGRHVARNLLESSYVYKNVGEGIPHILKIINKDKNLKKWKSDIAPFIVDYSVYCEANVMKFVEEGSLSRLLDNMESTEQLKLAFEFIKDYAEAIRPGNYDYSAYVLNALPALFKNLKSYEQMLILKKLIKEYIELFGEPYAYVADTLPMLLKKAGFKELELWDAEVKRLIRAYLERGRKNLYNLLKYEIYRILDGVKSLEELKQVTVR